MSVPGLPVDVVVVGRGARLLHAPRHVVALLAAPPPEQPAEVGARPLLAHGVSAGNITIITQCYLILSVELSTKYREKFSAKYCLRQLKRNVVDTSVCQVP